MSEDQWMGWAVILACLLALLALLLYWRHDEKRDFIEKMTPEERRWHGYE